MLCFTQVISQGLFKSRYSANEWLITCRLWPAKSPVLNLRDYFFWGEQKIVYVHSSHSLEELKDNI
jgi:hypothetical protein